MPRMRVWDDILCASLRTRVCILFGCLTWLSYWAGRDISRDMSRNGNSDDLVVSCDEESLPGCGGGPYSNPVSQVPPALILETPEKL